MPLHRLSLSLSLSPLNLSPSLFPPFSSGPPPPLCATSTLTANRSNLSLSSFLSPSLPFVDPKTASPIFASDVVSFHSSCWVFYTTNQH